MKYSEIQSIATYKLKNDLFNNIDFKLRKGGLGGGFGFARSDENRITSVGCGINIYGDFSVLRHLSSRIMFDEIEELFVPVAAKNALIGGHTKREDRTTISTIKIPGFENRNYSRYTEDIRIEDEKDIDTLVERFKEYYLEIASPAFESFTSIEQFVPLMENLDFYDFTKKFGMGSQFKKAIVWRLCNRTDYEEYMLDLVERTEKFLGPNRDQDEGFKWYNTAIELKKVLDKTPPKYNM